MRQRLFWALLACTSGALAQAQQELSLLDLRNAGQMRVTVDGRGVRAPADGRRVVYLERITGVRDGDEWLHFSVESRTTDDLLITTPHGTIMLPPVRVRLYLRPATVRRATEPGEVTAEYRLEPGRRYYARVASETYLLPPRADGLPPEQHVAYVLQISDRPFRRSKPVGPITPASGSIAY